MTSPTGSGKTVIAVRIIALALKLGQRVLVVVHRRELAEQMYKHIRHMGIKDVGVIMASDESLTSGLKRINPNAKVQVCGIATLISRGERPEADLVIVDEAHRAMAPSYQKVAEDYPEARHLGFTATPLRHDGIGMGDFYEELYTVETAPELVKAKWLVKHKAFTIPEHLRPSLKGLRVSEGDYALKQLEDHVDKPKFIGTIVEEIKRHASNRQTVIFAVGKQHAKHILKRVRRAGFSAELLIADTPQTEREQILGDFEKKRIQIIVNVGVLTEGWDMPVCKCVVLARPTKSLTLFLQMVGRIGRPYGNLTPLILDHVGACLKWGLPTDLRHWKLTTSHDEENGASHEGPMKACPECYETVVAGYIGSCPNCGAHEFEAPKREPDETEERLVEMKQLRERVEALAKKKGAGKAWVEKVLAGV